MACVRSQTSSSCYGSMESDLPRHSNENDGSHRGSQSLKNRVAGNGSSITESLIETDDQTFISVTSLAEQTTSSQVQARHAKSAKELISARKSNFERSKDGISSKNEPAKFKRLVFLSDLLGDPTPQPVGQSANRTRPKTAGGKPREPVQLPTRPKTAIVSSSIRINSSSNSSTSKMYDYKLDSKHLKLDVSKMITEGTNQMLQDSKSRRITRGKSAKTERTVENIKFRSYLPPEQKVAWLYFKREQEAAVIEQRNARKQRLRNLYWTAQWKVVWIIRWLKIMIKHSIQITPKTATEMQYHQLNNSIEARDLAFNKSVYDRERIHTRLAPWALTILTKEPYERNETDCRRLHALLRGLKSFDKFTERIQIALCQSFQYQYIESDRVILRKGHVGFNFYFIFSGSVFVDVEERDSAGNTFFQTETILHRGSSFGELALLKDIERQANIRCREPCELLVVEKDIFSNVCPRIFDRELEEKVEFISNMPLFQTKWWTDDALQSICFEAQIQEYKTGKIIVTDSAVDDWIYICMEGKCTIYKHLELESEFAMNADRRRSTFQRDITVESQQDRAIREAKEKRIMTEPKEQKEKHKLDKTRLLNSMALEWVQVHEKLKEVVNVHDEEDAVKIAKKSIENKKKPKEEEPQEAPSGVTSFTSFITDKMAQAGDSELVFLSIGTLAPMQVFDLFAIVRNHRGSASLILVSSGSKLLRIKRTRFFGCAAQEALKHAKMVSNKDEYKSDGELLYSYELKTKWDGFKHTVVNQVIEPHIEEARRRYLSNYLKGKQADKKRQADKLMSVLRTNKRRQKMEAKIKELNEKQEKQEQEKAKQNKFYEDEEDRKIRILAAKNAPSKSDGTKKKPLVRMNSQRWTMPVTKFSST